MEDGMILVYTLGVVSTIVYGVAVFYNKNK